MSVTPQTNTTLEEIAEALLKHDRFCICGHVSPDADCIGSQLALRLALKQLGKEVSVLLAKDDKLDASFDFLPGSDELLYAGDYQYGCEVFISVDVPTEKRLLDVAAALKAQADLTITIDHHGVPKRMSDLSYTDPDSASTTLLIWKLIPHLGIAYTSDIATCTYAGLITDTGRFQHQNTDAEALALASQMVRAGADASKISEQFFQRRSLASLKLEALTIDHMELFGDAQGAISWISKKDMQAVDAVKADCEPLVNVMRSLDTVRICCMLREEEDSVRGSFRAKDDIDVAALAEGFGGGGHRAAAGFTLHCRLDQAVQKVKHVMSKALKD